MKVRPLWQTMLQIILPALLAAQLSAQQLGEKPLGGVTRLQKSAKKAKHVITNDDLPPLSNPGSTSQAQGDQSDNSHSNRTVEAEKDLSSNKSDDLTEMKFLNERIASTEEQLQNEQSEDRRIALLQMLSTYRAQLEEVKERTATKKHASSDKQ
jgi:hypothetical protein